MFEGIRGNDFNRGATEYIDMNDSATLDYTMGTGDWTIDMLFRCETNNARMISSGGSTDSTEGFTLMVKSDNTVELEVSNGTSRWISAVTAAVTLNEWHHIIASIDRDVGWFIMIDGVIAASGTDTDANNIDGTTDLFIGARSAGAIDYWDGQLARTLLYKRAMSHEQASGMMSNPWQIFKPQDLHVPIEYEELTFDSTKEDRLFKIPQKRTKQP
jgi:hypothetical protein